MAKKQKLSRTEPVTTAPAGTPTAPSVQEAPAANHQTKVEAVGAFSEVIIPEVTAAEQERQAKLAQALKEAQDQPRQGGASWFIPPQKQSGFGVK
jgi:hypothetical protein